jgi:hypothetical protein
MYTPARPTRVDTDPAGAPLRLYWRGHWERVLGSTHWRIEDDWWREGGEIKRDYYKVWTAEALVAVVYLDGVGGGWYVEKIMD